MEQSESSAASERPLWRRIADFPLVVMIVAVAVFIAAYAAALFIGGSLPPLDPLVQLALRSLITVAIAFAAYKLIIARLGERPHDDLRLSGAPRDLALGLGAGAGLFAIVVAVAALIDVYNIVGNGGFDDLPRSLLAAAIVPAFMEELLFRGILFRWIEEFAGSWGALLVTSALFGLAHIYNPNATWFSSFAIAVEAGLLLGGAYMLTRSLWMPIGLHAAWNFTQGFIFDVPVSGTNAEGLVEAQLSGPELLSGGGFGLEASLIALIVATAAGIWLVARAAKQGLVVRPWWVRRRLADPTWAGSPPDL